MSTFAKMAPALRGQLVPYAFRPLEKWIGTGAFEILESDYSNLTYREKSGKFNENGPYESRPIQIELMQPLHGETIYDEFAQRKGSGLRDLGIKTIPIDGSNSAARTKRPRRRPHFFYDDA
jgi:hypothetical protein